MESISLQVGSVTTTNGGRVQDTRREVRFVGEPLGERSEMGSGRDGGPTDTRGTTEALYRAEDGRLVVHVCDWSKWQGEPSTYELVSAQPADFAPLGRFYDLGRECGLEQARPLTLDEALATEGGNDGQDN